jgi:hypothetical protein
MTTNKICRPEVFETTVQSPAVLTGLSPTETSGCHSVHGTAYSLLLILLLLYVPLPAQTAVPELCVLILF